MIEWTDATTYPRGERGNRPPAAWEARAGQLRIWVGSNHRDFPGEWVMHCFALGMEKVRLNLPDDTPAMTAQTVAVNKVGERLSQLTADFRHFG